MDLLVLTHDAPGSPGTRKLFALVGEYCADASLRSDLGTPISSAPGDAWLIARDGEAVAGFCVVSSQKNGRAKLHALHAPTAAIAGTLRRAAIKQAKAGGAKEIAYTAAPSEAAALRKDGWARGQERGQYITFTKEL